MNKPSERIVVFVTTAQKRAIAATADDLGISVSELMRRAVLSFGATSEQVKAASIVDRLRAPRAPDALDMALQRVARGTRHARAAQPSILQTRGASEGAGASAEASQPATSKKTAHSAAHAPGSEAPAPLLPAGVLAALAAAGDADAAATAEAVARMAAAEAAASDETVSAPADPDVPLRNVLRRPRLDALNTLDVSREKDDEEDDPRSDPSTEGGRFA